MTTFAFALVVASGAVHAGWSFLLKRSRDSAAFLWWLQAVAVLAYAPFALVGLHGVPRTWAAAGWAAGSAVLHGVYVLAMARAFQAGDLSVVYPISRGIGPALAPMLAVSLLGERPPLLVWPGIALVVAGVYVVNAGNLKTETLRRPLHALGQPGAGSAILVGVFAAAFAAWDKAALAFIPSVSLNWFGNAGNLLFLSAVVLRATPNRRGLPRVIAEWRRNPGALLAAGILSPGSYLLILLALHLAPLSRVAPLREISIVIGTALGVLVLREGYGPGRLAGSVMVAAGVLLVGFAR